MEESKMTIFANLFSYGNTEYTTDAPKANSPTIDIRWDNGDLVHLHFMGESSISTLHEAIHELKEKIKERDNKPKGGDSSDNRTE